MKFTSTQPHKIYTKKWFFIYIRLDKKKCCGIEHELINQGLTNQFSYHDCCLQLFSMNIMIFQNELKPRVAHYHQKEQERGLGKEWREAQWNGTKHQNVRFCVLFLLIYKEDFTVENREGVKETSCNEGSWTCMKPSNRLKSLKLSNGPLGVIVGKFKLKNNKNTGKMQARV